VVSEEIFHKNVRRGPVPRVAGGPFQMESEVIGITAWADEWVEVVGLKLRDSVLHPVRVRDDSLHMQTNFLLKKDQQKSERDP